MITSYNGWPASRDGSALGVVRNFRPAGGVLFAGGVRGGDVETVFAYLCQQFHKRVEPIVAGWCWGYYFKQSANSARLLSCHSSATAIDINAPRHPNGKRGTFTKAQVATIRAILAELGGVVYWGGDAWGGGTPDEMHFEITKDAAAVKRVADRIRGGDQITSAAPAAPVVDWLVLATIEAEKIQAIQAAEAAQLMEDDMIFIYSPKPDTIPAEAQGTTYPILINGFTALGLDMTDLQAHTDAGVKVINVRYDLWKQVVQNANAVMGVEA